ncbi:IS1595 family transposase [Endozoicomonas sp.]|uniref:IS1595 family transposase n=1 Tax=Endozoicomonas sp. TaxID=1892382 RepID=UPI00383A14E7
MEQPQFLSLLESIKSLSSEQTLILYNALPAPDTLDIKPDESQVLEAVEETFHKAPYCPRCHSDNVGGWGKQSGLKRYKCKACSKTFNALTTTPLAWLRVKDKLDQYLECMRGDTALRVAARQCGISLPTSFLLRHRLMNVIQADKPELLSGITELDETFFLENHKGNRGLKVPRKRGKRKARGKKSQSVSVEEQPKLIPVMVACDRQQHVTDAVLEHVSADELESHLSGRLKPGAILCADAHLSHESVARRLNLELKELVTSKGVYVIDDEYHIQRVNAYHSDLKSWINGFFKGVATKNLPKHLGLKRFLKTEVFTVDGLLERIASHWVKPLLN